MRCRRALSSVLMDAMIAAPMAPCHATGACLAEISPLTNRIRSQFARIKAVGADRRRSWLLWQMEGQAAPGDGQDMSKATLRRASGTLRTFLEDAKSGNVRAVGRGDHAAHHSTA